MALSLRKVEWPLFQKCFRRHMCPSVGRLAALRTVSRPCSTSSGPLALSEVKDGICKITLNNPKKRNALSLSMLESLQQQVSDCVKNPAVRVLVIGANGPVFSAGHDLRELAASEGRERHEYVFKKCTEVMTMIQDTPLPVIAQVKGLATAAGCQLVATCDIAIATESAKFATPGVSVGLFCSTPGVAVARAVPRKVAMEMLFTGQPISAQEALTHGLVSRVVPEEELDSAVMKIANRICEMSKSVNSLGKAFFYRQVQLDRDQAYREAVKVMVENLALPDGREGIQAFLDKRPPRWSN